MGNRLKRICFGAPTKIPNKMKIYSEKTFKKGSKRNKIKGGSTWKSIKTTQKYRFE